MTFHPFRDISSEFKSLVNVDDITIQSLYSDFQFLYYVFQENDAHAFIKIKEYLGKFKFLTYEISSTPIINLESQNKNFTPKLDLPSKPNPNIIFCGEKHYFIIENINFNLILDIIKYLNERNIKLIICSNNSEFPINYNKIDLEVISEVEGFTQNYV